MRRGRFGVGLAILVGVMAFAPAAFAASPRTIYQDYADNGKLDGSYSTADLQRALKDAVAQGYGAPSSGGTAGQGAGGIRPQGLQAALPPTRARGAAGTLPFTGTDLTLMTLGGGGLLLLGGGLRRAAGSA